jgi:hypothetical protein
LILQVNTVLVAAPSSSSTRITHSKFVGPGRKNKFVNTLPFVSHLSVRPEPEPSLVWPELQILKKRTALEPETHNVTQI